MKKTERQRLGALGEQLAVDYLIDKGWQILARNWRHRRAEVDIIAMDGKVLTFVEVKTRSYDFFKAGELAITPRKESLLADAARVYATEIEHDWEVRFDVMVLIAPNAQQCEIRHYEDVFLP